MNINETVMNCIREVSRRTRVPFWVVCGVAGVVAGLGVVYAVLFVWWAWQSYIAPIGYWESQSLFALLNWSVCGAIGWSCICRISVTSSETTRWLTRISYSALLTTSTASGYGPLVQHWPDWPELLMNSAVLLLLLDGARRWREGLPNDVRKERRKTPRGVMEDPVS